MPAAVYRALQSAVLLCIDDDEDMLECEKSFLESFGYSVLTAASGGKGLELCSRNVVPLCSMCELCIAPASVVLSLS